jgi:hypothetical protein
MNAALGWQFHVLKPDAFASLGLDENHGHPKIKGQYHYHGIPTGLIKVLRRKGYTQEPLLIGFAADGFPIYYDSKVDSQYRLRQGYRPEGAPQGKFDGTFCQDFEFIASSTPGALDECNGRFGTTPEFPEGIYHYFITKSYPEIPRMFKGMPDITFVEFGVSSACSPLPDTLWAWGGLSQQEVDRLKSQNQCLLDPKRPKEPAPPSRHPEAPISQDSDPERIFQALCGDCHGSQGEELRRLAGQVSSDEFVAIVRRLGQSSSMPTFDSNTLTDKGLVKIFDWLNRGS